MSVFSGLSAADRAEIDRAIRCSYERNDGTVRTVTEATQEFLSWLASATQAHREYADVLRSEWEHSGAEKFVKERWKALSTVHFKRADGSTAARPGNRGVLRTGNDGRATWVQPSMLLWGAEDLRQGIADAARSIDQARVTIANYRYLLALLDRTGCTLVHEALDAIGMSLDEYLATNDFAA